MGVDFDVILEHHFDESNIIDLPHRLNQNAEVAAAIARLRKHLEDFHGWKNYYSRHLDKDPFWQWIDRTGNGWDGIDPTSIFDGSVELYGPINNFISFERHVVWTSQPHPRWSLVWGMRNALPKFDGLSGRWRRRLADIVLSIFQVPPLLNHQRQPGS